MKKLLTMFALTAGTIILNGCCSDTNDRPRNYNKPDTDIVNRPDTAKHKQPTVCICLK